MHLKKLLLFLVSASFLQTSAAKADVMEDIGTAAFACAFYVCPVMLGHFLGIDRVVAIKSRAKDHKAIVSAGDDAAFFKAHVLAVEPDKERYFIYNTMVVQVAPEDVLTQVVRVRRDSSDKSSYYYEDVDAPLVVDQTQPFTLTKEIHGLKINGRELISTKLSQAHQAAHSLMIDDVIKLDGPEDKLAPWKAMVLNEAVLQINRSPNKPEELIDFSNR